MYIKDHHLNENKYRDSMLTIGFFSNTTLELDMPPLQVMDASPPGRAGKTQSANEVRNSGGR